MKNISKRIGYLIVAVFWLVILTLWSTKTQAQMLPCDSISYTILSGSGGNTTLQLNGTVTSGFSFNTIIWSWQVCDNSLCFGDSGQFTVWNQFTVTDTLKVCLTTILEVNNTWITCLQCDSLIYGPTGWMMMNMGNPLSILELETNPFSNNKMYDMLGRELFYIPTGTMYIQNRKIYIKQ